MPPKEKNGSGRRLPRSWPEGVVYLHAPCYSKRMQKDATNAVVFVAKDLPATNRHIKTSGPYSSVKITPITNSSHPAYGQYGLYTTQHLSPDTFVLPYLGYVHDTADLDENSDYDLSLDREYGIGVDASKMGNEARFMNDYRGVAPGPNAEFRDILVDIGGGKVEKRMGVYVLSAGKSGKRAKGIGKGEEILISYGKGFWTERRDAGD